MTWHTHDGQRAYGPFSEAQVIGMIQSGQLRGGHVARDGSGQWVPLASHPPFAAALTPLGASAPVVAPARPVAKRSGGGAKAALAIGAVMTVLVGGGVGIYAMSGSSDDDGEARSGSRKKSKSGIEVKMLETKVEERILVVRIQVGKKGKSKLEVSATAKRKEDSETAELERWQASLDETDDAGRFDAKFAVGLLEPGKYQGSLTVQTTGSQKKKKVSFSFEIAESLRGKGYGDDIACTGKHTCSVGPKSGGIEVTAPSGTIAVVGGVKKTVSGTSAQFAFNVSDQLAKLNPRSISDAEVPIELTFGDGAKVKGNLTMSKKMIEAAIGDLLVTIKKGGINFPGDDAAPAKARLVAETTSSGYGLKLHGSGDSMKAIDLVAINESKTQKGSCGSYRNGRTGEIVTVEKNMYHEQVTLYERRTGKVKATKYFAAPPESCPSTMSPGSSVSSFVPDSDVAAFIKSHM